MNELRELEAEFEPPVPTHRRWRGMERRRGRRVGWDSLESGSCRRPGRRLRGALARRFRTVGGIVAALRSAVADACGPCGGEPAREGAPLAASHGTRYPIVQGPMTRVSDRAEFAAAVAEGGALPFLALALMRGPDVDALLDETRHLLGGRPWGVGILGFVPQELRDEQLEVIRVHRPPFALIAGGRPDQARALEDEGITTYLHVPSPGLLRLFLDDGARRFVFEGRECGGHVGPRSSFVLWDTMVRTLLEELPPGSSDCHVLFAGGIHDAARRRWSRRLRPPPSPGCESACCSAPPTCSPEAVECGAITPTFQEAAVAGDSTVLLETGPGHATRCLPSPYVEQFEAEKRPPSTRGPRRGGAARPPRAAEPRPAADRHQGHRARSALPQRPRWGEAGPGRSRRPVGRGMYMIGQVAALRDRTGALADLHHDVSAGSSDLLRRLPAPRAAAPDAPPPADVAIVGLGCVLPGAPTSRTFWGNILDRVDAITEVPADRWDWRRYYDPDPAAPDKVYSRWGGFLDDVPFDPLRSACRRTRSPRSSRSSCWRWRPPRRPCATPATPTGRSPASARR